MASWGFRHWCSGICFCHRNVSQHHAQRENPKGCKKREAGHSQRHVNRRVWVYLTQPWKWEDHGEMLSKLWRKMVVKAEISTSQISQASGRVEDRHFQQMRPQTIYLSSNIFKKLLELCSSRTTIRKNMESSKQGTQLRRGPGSAWGGGGGRQRLWAEGGISCES